MQIAAFCVFLDSVLQSRDFRWSQGILGNESGKKSAFFSWRILNLRKKSEKNQDSLISLIHPCSLIHYAYWITGLFSWKASLSASSKTDYYEIHLKKIEFYILLYLFLWLTFDMYYANKILIGFTTFNRSKVALLASELRKWIMAR